jgi:hypothetical protein
MEAILLARAIGLKESYWRKAPFEFFCARPPLLKLKLMYNLKGQTPLKILTA